MPIFGFLHTPTVRHGIERRLRVIGSRDRFCMEHDVVVVATKGMSVEALGDTAEQAGQPRVETVDAVRPVAANPDQFSVEQPAKLMRHHCPFHTHVSVDSLGDLARGVRTRTENLDDAPPHRVPELEEQFHEESVLLASRDTTVTCRSGSCWTGSPSVEESGPTARAPSTGASCAVTPMCPRCHVTTGAHSLCGSTRSARSALSARSRQSRHRERERPRRARGNSAMEHPAAQR